MRGILNDYYRQKITALPQNSAEIGTERTDDTSETRVMGRRLREKILLTCSPSVTGEAFKSLLNHLISR